MGKVGKPIELTSRAIKDLHRIYKFNVELYGISKAGNIVGEVLRQLEILEKSENNFSKIGAIDHNFDHLKYEYRKLIVRHIKITYREGKSKIYVVRFFDTRQDPYKNY